MNSSQNKKWEDPIVAEVHAIREKMMAEYNNDLHAFAAEIMRRQARTKHTLVSFEGGKRRVLRRNGKNVAGAKRTIGKTAK